MSERAGCYALQLVQRNIRRNYELSATYPGRPVRLRCERGLCRGRGGAVFLSFPRLNSFRYLARVGGVTWMHFSWSFSATSGYRSCIFLSAPESGAEPKRLLSWCCFSPVSAAGPCPEFLGCLSRSSGTVAHVLRSKA